MGTAKVMAEVSDYKRMSVWFRSLTVVDQWEVNNWCRFWLNSDVTRSHWLSRLLRLVGTRSSCFMRLDGTCDNLSGHVWLDIFWWKGGGRVWVTSEKRQERFELRRCVNICLTVWTMRRCSFAACYFVARTVVRSCGLVLIRRLDSILVSVSSKLTSAWANVTDIVW